jgi:hypothetical protein
VRRCASSSSLASAGRRRPPFTLCFPRTAADRSQTAVSHLCSLFPFVSTLLHGPAWTPCSRPLAQPSSTSSLSSSLGRRAARSCACARQRPAQLPAACPFNPRCSPTHRNATSSRRQALPPSWPRPCSTTAAADRAAPGSPVSSSGRASGLHGRMQPAASRSPCRSPSTTSARCPFAPVSSRVQLLFPTTSSSAERPDAQIASVRSPHVRQNLRKNLGFGFLRFARRFITAPLTVGPVLPLTVPPRSSSGRWLFGYFGFGV